MTELKMEHVLILLIAVFLLYHLTSRCSCNNGFRVGGQKFQFIPIKRSPEDSRRQNTDKCLSVMNWILAEQTPDNSKLEECVNYKDSDYNCLTEDNEKVSCDDSNAIDIDLSSLSGRERGQLNIKRINYNDFRERLQEECNNLNCNES